MRHVIANEASATKRRVYFHLVDAVDGITAETGEDGGQPQISINGGAWTNTGISTITVIGSGRYYADLTQGVVQTVGDVIETHYKSTNTAECPGDSVQVVTDVSLLALETSVAALSAQVSGIGSGTGAALNFAADDDNANGTVGTLTLAKVGTETGTFANTAADDTSTHVIASAANVIDWAYNFSCGAAKSASKITWKGILSGGAAAVDTFTFSAYNWDTDVYDVRFVIANTSAAVQTFDIPLLAAHTGKVGTEAGEIVLRIQFSEADAGTVTTNLLLAQANQSGSLVGYADGAIWIGGSNTNTVPYIDGTADNPVTYAAALTLATALGLTRFRVRNGTSITLTASAANRSFIGVNWTLALGGQAIDGAYFDGAEVSGTGTCTAQAEFSGCHINAGTTMGPGKFMHCGFAGTSGSKVTAGSAGEFVLVDCFSEVAGSGTPHFSFPGACGVNFRRWSGGSNIALTSASATLTMEVVTGGGQTIATAGASIELRGICRAVSLTGIASGATCQIDAVTGPIILEGADGTVNIYGVCGPITDSRTGSPATNNHAVSRANNAIDVRTGTGMAAANLDTQLGDIPTNSELATALAGADDITLAAIAALKDFDPANDVVARVTLVDTVTDLSNAPDLSGVAQETTAQSILAVVEGVQEDVDMLVSDIIPPMILP